MEILQTKVTKRKKGLYGCRIIHAITQKPIVELRVAKNQISDAFFDMLRTLDKLGYDSKMARSSRHRQKGKCVSSKYIWF